MSRGQPATFAVPVVLSALVACTPRHYVDRTEGIGSLTSGTELARVPTRGYPAVVEYADGCTLEGELLAQDWRNIWLSHESGRVVLIELSSVGRVLIELYPSHPLAMGVWTGIGTVSTLSHGFFLVLTGPTWLASGIASTVHEAEVNDYAVEGSDLGDLWQFTRYPQGPPPALAAGPTARATCGATD
jgi:hypothetical protein